MRSVTISIQTWADCGHRDFGYVFGDAIASMHSLIVAPERRRRWTSAAEIPIYKILDRVAEGPVVQVVATRRLSMRRYPSPPSLWCPLDVLSLNFLRDLHYSFSVPASTSLSRSAVAH